MNHYFSEELIKQINQIFKIITLTKTLAKSVFYINGKILPVKECRIIEEIDDFEKLFGDLISYAKTKRCVLLLHKSDLINGALKFSYIYVTPNSKVENLIKKIKA